MALGQREREPESGSHARNGNDQNTPRKDRYEWEQHRMNKDEAPAPPTPNHKLVCRWKAGKRQNSPTWSSLTLGEVD
eukprot:ctg_2095.g520